MNLILDILIICTCTWLSYEDFKDRQISVWAIVLLGVFILSALLISKNNRLNENIFFNLLFIGILFLFLKIKARKKNQEMKNVFDQMGEGDWLVMLIFAFAFHYMNYLAFFIISIIAYLLLSRINYIHKKTNVQLVPLAGLLCTTFIIQVILKHISPEISLLTNTIGF
jgi:hypothetical protein